MDIQSIHDMLDSLDHQLATGKIDLDTYNKLTAKWQAKLASSSATPTIPAPATAAVTAVACPECSAALEDTSVAPGSVVRCGFCRATFTFKQAQEQTERASNELKHWLDQMVVESGSAGAVDATSRKFIFAEKIYPALQLDYRRGMELYDDVHEYPLISFDALNTMPRFAPNDHALVRSTETIPRLRALSLKLNSPLVASFALAEDDRRKLRDLDVGASNLVYLANVAKLLVQPSPEAYQSAKENLMALDKEYAEYLTLTHDLGYRKYLEAMRTRLEANVQVLDILARVFTPDADFAPQVFLQELEIVRTKYQEAHQLCDESTHNPIMVVPLKSGLEREEKILALIEAILTSYRIGYQKRPLTFLYYYNDLKVLLGALARNPNDPMQLVTAIEQINTILIARRGEPALRFVDDWNWCANQVEMGRKQSLFGGGEIVASQAPYWHPFWFATIRYSIAKGAIFTSGVEQAGYMLMDATNDNATPVVVTATTPTYPSVHNSVQLVRPSDATPILPPLVARATADRAINAAARRVPDWRTVQTKIESVVYLPALIVTYQSKSGSRQAFYSMLPNTNANASQLLSQINPFFERYA